MAINLRVLVWGINEQGRRFAQAAIASNISGHGALFTGIEEHLRCGDLVGVQYQAKRAKFRVVWARESRHDGKMQLAVQKLASEECPWPEELPVVRNEVAAARAAD